MRLYFRLVLGLMVAFGSAAAGVVGVVRSQPTEPALTGWFTRTDGSPCVEPCMFGVQPGRSSLQDALNAIRKHPVTAGMRARVRRVNGIALFGRDFTMGFTERQVILEMRVARSDAVGTRLYDTLRKMTLGAVVAELGTPDSFAFQALGLGPGLRMCLYYDAFQVEVCGLRTYQPGMRFGLDDFPSYVAIYSEQTYRSYKSIYGGRWSGFVAVSNLREKAVQ